MKCWYSSHVTESTELAKLKLESPKTTRAIKICRQRLNNMMRPPFGFTPKITLHEIWQQIPNLAPLNRGYQPRRIFFLTFMRSSVCQPIISIAKTMATGETFNAGCMLSRSSGSMPHSARSTANLSGMRRRTTHLSRPVRAPVPLDTLFQTLVDKAIVLVGDFHTLHQSRRSFLRLLRRTASQNHILIGLEYVEARHQEFVDQYLADELSLEALSTALHTDADPLMGGGTRMSRSLNGLRAMVH